MADSAFNQRAAVHNIRRAAAMNIPHLILGYLIVTLSGLAGAMIYTEFRQRRFKPMPSKDRIFRCSKCGCVYTDDPDVDHSRCSQCGQLNEAIEF